MHNVPFYDLTNAKDRASHAESFCDTPDLPALQNPYLISKNAIYLHFYDIVMIRLGFAGSFFFFGLFDQKTSYYVQKYDLAH